MSNFFNQLASGNSVPLHQGVQCTVRPFPWTEEFVKDGVVVHYYETDERPLFRLESLCGRPFLKKEIQRKNDKNRTKHQ